MKKLMNRYRTTISVASVCGIVWVMTFAAALMALPRPALADSPVTFFLDPMVVKVQAGQEFDVLVKVKGANNLGGFQFDLIFPSAMLEARTMKLDSFLTSTGRTPIPLGPKIDNTNGRITFGAATAGNAPGASGNGVLLRATFRALTSGTGAMNIAKYQVLDAQGKTLVAAVRGNKVQVVGSPVPATSPVRPTSVSEATEVPASPSRGGTFPIVLVAVVAMLLVLGIGGLVLRGRQSPPE
ncbi:MAG: hypothetical protein GXP41_02560 [Chloroflexi bacterium]|nr:hypothetical protein [Chloroflexota bacterium]